MGQQTNNNELDNIDYSFSFLFSLKWIAGLVLFFVITLLTFIPFKSTLDSIIYSSLKINSSCSVKIKDYTFEFFMPKVIFNNIKIPGSCMQGKIPQGIDLKSATLNLRGISFSPFGLSTKLETQVYGQKIEAYLIPGLSSLSILLSSKSENGKFISDTNRIQLNRLAKLFPSVKLSGDIYLSDIYLQLSYAGKMKDLVINIASNNLLLPAQSIGLPPDGAIKFALSSLKLNSLLIQALKKEGQIVEITNFVLGDENSPIKAKFAGDIKLNTRNIKQTGLNLKGELGLSNEFLDKYAILKMLLASFDKKDNFYQIQLKGTLASPKTSSAR